MENPINKIDFTTLRGQKKTLLDVITKLEEGCKDQLEIDDLTGILHLIDAIQDYAVDELGVPEMHVFDFELEEEREQSTPFENFARDSAENIFDELCESDGFHTDDEMPSKFIESMMADRYQADIIKAKIRAQILNDLKENPEAFQYEKNVPQYDADMREDYEGLVTQYIREQFNSGKTKSVWLCPNCGSDNVETKNWVNANTGELGTDCEDEQGYCQDCQQHGELIAQELPLNKTVVGYQVVDDEAGDIHPDMEGSFCLYNLSQAKGMLEEEIDGNWKLLCIWSGDVEDATLMFEGDPRD